MISFVGAGIVVGAEKAWVECQDLFADSPYKRAGLVCLLLFVSRYRIDDILSFASDTYRERHYQSIEDRSGATLENKSLFRITN